MKRKTNFRIIGICADKKSREQGLRSRTPLQTNQGLFFIFPTPGNYSFWNKGVRYPIDLIFMDKSFVVVDIGYLEAQQSEPYTPDSDKVTYVLEVNRGQGNRIKIGQQYRVVQRMVK